MTTGTTFGSNLKQVLIGLLALVWFTCIPLHAHAQDITDYFNVEYDEFTGYITLIHKEALEISLTGDASGSWGTAIPVIAVRTENELGVLLYLAIELEQDSFIEPDKLRLLLDKDDRLYRLALDASEDSSAVIQYEAVKEDSGFAHESMQLALHLAPGNVIALRPDQLAAIPLSDDIRLRLDGKNGNYELSMNTQAFAETMVAYCGMLDVPLHWQDPTKEPTQSVAGPSEEDFLDLLEMLLQVGSLLQ